MPANFNNNYFKRRDMIQGYLYEVKSLGLELGLYKKCGLKDTWSNFYNSNVDPNEEIITEKDSCHQTLEEKVISRLANRLEDLNYYVTGMGPTGAKNPWHKRYHRKKLRSFKRSTKDMIKVITEGDCSEWSVDI